MYKTINFNRTVSFLGRNGNFKSLGIEVIARLGMFELVSITPITSKHLTGRCEIEIPKENIPELIEALRSCL